MKKVLIIEDDEILQRMYTKKLLSVGYDVIGADDGRKGLTLAETEHPDLILLDIMLPGGLNGFDVLEQLKRNEKTKDMLVLVLTNLASEEHVAKQIGAAGYLVKASTKPDQLVAAVKNLLQ